MAETTERLQEAIAIARAGNTSEALSIAEELVQEDPENPHALFLRGMLAESKEEQIEYMEKVLAIDPEHKAATKRMAQLAPVVVEEEVIEEIGEDEPQEVEVEEEPAGELVEDATVIAGAAVIDEVAAEETLAEVEDEEMVEEEIEEELGEAEAPISESMASEDLEEEESSEALEATLVGAALLEETVFDDVSDQSEEIPEWLLSEARSEEDIAEVDETALWGEEDLQEPTELPDWLKEEPEGEWVEEEAPTEGDTETVVAAGAIPDSEEVGAAAVAATDLEPGEADESPAQDTDLAVEAPKKPKKSATSGLEIGLYVLIILALLLVVGLAWVIIAPPF